MAYDHSARANRLRAASLLQQLRKARAPAADAGTAVETPLTAEASAGQAYWRLSNVAGAHVYATVQGWHADLAFRNLPSDIPNILGSAVPLPSRRAALDAASRHLALCAERERLPLPQARADVLRFAFDAVAVPVDPGMLAEYRARAARDGFTRDNTQRELARLRYTAAGDGPLSVEAYAAASPEIRRDIKFACCVAMAVGLKRFTREDAIWEEDLVESTLSPGMLH
ncbi:hypothetical protein BV511_02235 [Methylorubrum extorquens]|uniref:hypothetical protein n=1 Tax=Methylorubrum extorquens TaxID=408 RepID=UPI000972952E|nr:hypothetical protein [Methylorubrum extorquens]APX83657.1 hypothetical protein BV511_02235 [Methylorubrum extorquens]